MKKSNALLVFFVGLVAALASFWAVTANTIPEYGLALAIVTPAALVAYLAKSRKDVLPFALVIIVSFLAGYAIFWISLRYVVSHI